MKKYCKDCKISNTIYNSGGNNSIISLVLNKFTLEELKNFMYIIYKILSRQREYKFEIIEDFFITEDEFTFTLHDYLIKKLNDYHENENHYDINDIMFTLKSLFIISMLHDNRILIFLFGNHDKLNNIKTPFFNINIIKDFYFECFSIVNSFKNNQCSLKDISYHATKHWNQIGMYVNK